MAEARGGVRAAPLAPLLWRWAPVLLWLALSALLVRLIPAQVPAGPPQRFAPGDAGWVLSDGMRVPADPDPSPANPFPANLSPGNQDRLHWQGAGAGPHIASRRLTVPAQSEFLEVEACSAGDTGPGVAEVMLSSIYRGRLDFNRAYRLGAMGGAGAGECLSAAFPRRTGDGPAVLQIQLPGHAEEKAEEKAGGKAEDKVRGLALTHLSLRPLQENPVWRWTRRCMLPAGIALLVLALAGYARRGPALCAWAGLLVVAGILFGCCVSVFLKADIYAALTGGRSLVAPAPELLRIPFPIGGFPIFTYLHALLFGLASLLLGLTRRRAWQDLMLLGLTTEALQLFVPGRGPGYQDVLVDWIGVFLGLVLVVLLRRSSRVSLFLQE